MAQHMLTTVDNPYNPFTEFDEWLSYDTANGHDTLNFLARVLVTSEELSEADQEAAVEDAINEIVFYNVTGMYRKVEEKDSSP